MLHQTNKLFLVFTLALLITACGGDDSEAIVSSAGGALTLSTPVSGQVATSGKVLYTLEATAGMIYEFNVHSLQNPSIVICEVADCPSGSNGVDFIDYQQEYDGALAWYSATVTTTLYIYISGADDDHGGTYDAKYTIDASIIPTSIGGTTLTTTLTHGVVYQGDITSYTLPVTSGNSYQFGLNIEKGDVSLQVCSEADCNTNTGIVFNTPQDGNSVFEQLLMNHDGLLYIHIQGVENSIFNTWATQATSPL